MKLLKKKLEPQGSGEITLLPGDGEDMWHAFNLIRPGDRIRATTMRKVQSESATGSVSSQKLKITLTIQVLDVAFDVQACTLRVKGRNVEESKHVKMGQHHTIEMELHRKFTLFKEEWDSISLDRIDLACNPERSADTAAVVLREGSAKVALLTDSMTVVKASIDVSIPKKRQMNESSRTKAVEKFYTKVAEAILASLDFSVVKVVVVASPGFTKDDFLAFLWRYATRNHVTELISNKSKFMPVHSSTGYLHDIKEVLADPSLAKTLADTKAAQETAALNRFFTMLGDDPDRAFYGYDYVKHALDAQAIDTLLLTDELFRSKSIAERRQYIALTEAAKENGSEVRILSSLHVSGQQLAQLSGVAAILRFPMPEVEVELEGQDSDDSDDSDQDAAPGTA
eukprot:m.85607 g.85607  ORF g.85607 m.85607 type:complete len:398 (-) comp12783_c0_seq3:406-1599(-)